MCGIAGIAFWGADRKPDPSVVKVMCDTLRHRGPNAEGFHMKDGVAMGMRRLAIIDVQGGNQPIFNEDGTIAVMFNGEIYNYMELREELRRRGHVFATQSDTEVIVHAYEAFGVDFPKHLNGMFAVALHDMPRRKLILARDHMGIKPLYYSLSKDRLVWGSEIKAVLASSLVARELDMEAMGEFLTWEYTPGAHTLLKTVRRLEPASTLAICLAHGDSTFATYWDVPPSDPEAEHSETEWMSLVDTTLRKCVRRQLVSDVPLGAFLSGGVDSSLVVAGMGPTKTFSIGFDDPAYDELRWAKRVALHLQLDNISEVISPNAMDLYSRLMFYLDDPIGDFSIFPTYLVSQLARKHVTVSLSGDGGDELFGGYETYLADRIDGVCAHYLPHRISRSLFSCLKRWPASLQKGSFSSKLIRYAEGTGFSPSLHHARWRCFAGEPLLSALLLPEAHRLVTADPDRHVHELFKRAGHRDGMNRNLYVDLKSYLPDCLLIKLDRMSMAVSLESRVPFLDRELVELALRVPGHLKVRGLATKYLLKKVASRHVPSECIFRSKRGFTVPVRNWLMNSLRPLMDDLLDSGKMRAQGIFHEGAVERLKMEHLQGIANHSHLLWSLMVFQSWHRQWLRT